MSFINFKNKDVIIDSINLMCRLFWGPDLDSCRNMMKDDFFQSINSILTESEAKSSLILDNIKSITNKFETHTSLYEHLNECYVRLFVNSREGITTPLYASCYEFENAPMMGKSAVEMTQRFKSKGLSMGNMVHEPPDHLSIELEYLFFLLQQEDEWILDEATAFAGETMLPWVVVFNQRLTLVEEDCRFYSHAAGMLVLLLSQISKLK